jgi:4,5:9,10-diseco-3-hydroxy-5,9,17-trioxoandrosta-1(10),2-diene-4-oate hydrolase
MNLEIKSRWVKVGEVNTHYMAAGEGFPLLLLHGGANDWSDWNSNIDPLSQHYRVYAPDLVGYGLSDQPEADYTMSYFVNFLYNFTQALELKRANLAGYSVGGGIALGFALRFPGRVEKLILVDSTGLGKDINPLGRFIGTLGTLRGRLRGQRALPHLKGTERVVFLDRLPEVQIPTLIVWGKRDIYLSVAYAYLAHKLLANSQLHVFPRSGHAPHKERSEEFNQLVLDFLGGKS